MMSWPYAHLLINHFPVVLSIAALAVTVLALILGRRGLWLTAMEALTAAAIAALCLYDTAKPYDRSARIDELRLLSKSGGKSGDYSTD